MNQFQTFDFHIRSKEYYFSDNISEEKKFINKMNLPLINRTLISPFQAEPEYLIYPIEAAYILANSVSYFIVESCPVNNVISYNPQQNQLSTSSLTEEQALNESM